MKTWSKFIFGALTGLGIASAAQAGPYGPSNPASVDKIPDGFTFCADDGKICRVPKGATNVFVAWGPKGGNKFATAQGTGDFTCLPNGWVKPWQKDQPPDLGIEDPAPKVPKACYIMAQGGATPQPTPPAQPTPTPTPNPTPPAKPVQSPPPTGTMNTTGLTQCGVDGKVCNASGAWKGVYGVAGTSKYAQISGSGPFTCLPKGFVKVPSAAHPADTGVDDPAPGVAKACYIDQVIAQAAPTPAPVPVHATPASGCKDVSATAPANCLYRTQSNRDYSASCSAEADCSCRCAANMSKNCMFNSRTINKPVCMPGQTP